MFFEIFDHLKKVTDWTSVLVARAEALLGNPTGRFARPCAERVRNVVSRAISKRAAIAREERSST